MIPIQELLNKIRWDKSFAKGTFRIGCYGRMEDEIVSVTFWSIRFIEGNRFAFQVEDEYGSRLTVLLHRVRRGVEGWRVDLGALVVFILLGRETE